MAYLVQFATDPASITSLQSIKFYESLDEVDLGFVDYWKWKNIKCALYFDTQTGAETFAELIREKFGYIEEGEITIKLLQIYDNSIVGYAVDVGLLYIKVYECISGQEVGKAESFVFFQGKWQPKEVFVKVAKNLINQFLDRDPSKKSRYGYVGYKL